MKLFLIFLLINIISPQERKPIDEAFIETNFKILSQKENIRNSIYKLMNTGNLNLLKHYLTKLKEHKINYNNDLEDAINTKLVKIHSIYNKLKYKDEYDIQKLSPAFIWSEDLYVVKLMIQHSSSFGMTQCNEVDDEEFIIRKDKQNIIYRSRCVVSGYQIKFELKLRLYDKIKKIRHDIKERGQTIYHLEKEKGNEMWDRLQPPGERLPDNSKRIE